MAPRGRTTQQLQDTRKTKLANQIKNKIINKIYRLLYSVHLAVASTWLLSERKIVITEIIVWLWWMVFSRGQDC